VKLYAVIALTVVMYGAYVVCDRVLRMRKARRELRRRRIWWQALARAHEAEQEAEDHILGV
jgi:hypothetical protein